MECTPSLTLGFQVQCWPVLTNAGVQALVFQEQSLYRLSADDMGVYDLIYIGQRDRAIPDRFRVNDKVRSMLTLIKTPSLVGADFALKPPFGELLLEALLKLRLSARIAAPARMSRGTHVAADEDVPLKLRHKNTLPNQKGWDSRNHSIRFACFVHATLISGGQLRAEMAPVSISPVLLLHFDTLALCSAARASSRVESRVGRGEFESLMMSGISVQPRTTASHPTCLILEITR